MKKKMKILDFLLDNGAKYVGVLKGQKIVFLVALSKK